MKEKSTPPDGGHRPESEHEPTETGQEHPETFISKQGFSVTWLERGELEAAAWGPPMPGIQVCMWRPDGHLKEKQSYPLARRDQALETFRTMVDTVKKWDNITPE